MPERVEFHAKLATRGYVYIPKIMVERWRKPEWWLKYHIRFTEMSNE